MTIKEAYKKAFRCMSMADFIYQSAEAMGVGYGNNNKINIEQFSFGLASVAQKMSDDLSDVTDYLREVAGAEPESEVSHD